MLTHVVLISLQEGATDEQVTEVVDGLRALPAQIDELRSMTCERDAGIPGSGADLVLIATFDDAEAFATYRGHPAHVAVGQEVLKPILASATTAQFVS